MKLLSTAFCALLACAALPAQAATVVLWPLDPVIPADAKAAAVWIENRGDQPVTMQIRSLGWNQDNGEDNHVRQADVVSSPPIAEIAPGGRQLIRLIRRDAVTGKGEQAYRLLIDELPRPVTDTAPAARLAVQLRYSIPLFTYGDAPAAPAMLAGNVGEADGRRFIEIRNDGGRRARLTDLRLGQQVVLQGLVGYVLPGATRRFPLPAGAPRQGPVVVGVDGAEQTLPASAG